MHDAYPFSLLNGKIYHARTSPSDSEHIINKSRTLVPSAISGNITPSQRLAQVVYSVSRLKPVSLLLRSLLSSASSSFSSGFQPQAQKYKLRTKDQERVLVPCDGGRSLSEHLPNYPPRRNDPCLLHRFFTCRSLMNACEALD